MKEVILINIAGDDKLGLTSLITEILADYDIDILDMGQSVIHDTLSLGMLVAFALTRSRLFSDTQRYFIPYS